MGRLVLTVRYRVSRWYQVLGVFIRRKYDRFGLSGISLYFSANLVQKRNMWRVLDDGLSGEYNRTSPLLST